MGGCNRVGLTTGLARMRGQPDQVADRLNSDPQIAGMGNEAKRLNGLP